MDEGSVTLDVTPDSVTLLPGDTAEMEASLQNLQGEPVTGYEITWSSDDTAIATVDAKGRVVGETPGSTGITASAEKNGAETLSARSDVTVDAEGESSDLLTNLVPEEYEIDSMGVGENVYVDRGFTIDVVPARYDDWKYVRTANDDKSVEDETAITFTLTDTVTVALAYDQRATTIPAWLEDWAIAADTLGTTDADYDIFTRVLGPGEIELGGNQSGGAAGAQSMYLLFYTSSALPPGGLKVSASTSGDNQDANGYTVTADKWTSKDLGPNASVTFSDLFEGNHGVELSDIQSNCSLDGSNPRTVSVTAGNTASTSFSVTCSATAGALEVSASTSGDDQDSDGYTVTVDGSTSKDLSPNGTATFSGLSEGGHSVELSGIQSNCAVDGSNPKTVSVTAGNTASTSFSVSCTSTGGSIQAVEIPSQSDFTDQGVILEGDSCGAWDWWFWSPLGVVKKDGTYYFYYMAGDGSRPDKPCDSSGSHRNRFVGVATSSDGRNFTKSDQNPIIKHQPSGGVDNDLSGEGGVWMGNAFLDGDTIVLHVGGMEETSFESVDSDVVYFDSADGETFGNQTDAAKAGSVPGSDEIAPVANVKIDGTWYVYYFAKGGDVTNRTGYLLQGSDPTNLEENGATKLSGIADGELKNGAGLHRISEDRVMYVNKPEFGVTDHEVRTAPVSDMSDLSTLEDTWNWSDLITMKLFLDRDSDEWMLFYMSGDGGNRTFGLMTAPVAYK